jgi:hypothetical protein
MPEAAVTQRIDDRHVRQEIGRGHRLLHVRLAIQEDRMLGHLGSGARGRGDDDRRPAALRDLLFPEVVPGLAGVRQEGRGHLGHVQDASPADAGDHVESPLLGEGGDVLHDGGGRLGRIPLLDDDLHVQLLGLQARQGLLQQTRGVHPRTGDDQNAVTAQPLGLLADPQNAVQAEDDVWCAEFDRLKHLLPSPFFLILSPPGPTGRNGGRYS